MNNIKIKSAFRHNGQRFAAGDEAALLKTEPKPEQLADWLRRGKIEGSFPTSQVQSESDNSNVLSKFGNDKLEIAAEIITISELLDDEADENETYSETLKRVIQERDDAESEIEQVSNQVSAVVAALPSIEGVQANAKESDLAFLLRYVGVAATIASAPAAEAQTGTGEANTSQGEVENADPDNKPLSALELTEVTNPQAAIAILEAGYDTRGKLKAASDEKIKEIKHVGDVYVAKLREWLK